MTTLVPDPQREPNDTGRLNSTSRDGPAANSDERNQREYREAVRDAQLELANAALSRLEVFLGAVGILIGTFAIAITVGVAVMALRVEKSALALVAREVATEMEKIKSISDKVSELHNIAGEKLEIIRKAAAQAGEFLTEEDVSDAEQSEMAAAAAAIGTKPVRELTVEELRVRIGLAVSQREWGRVIELATFMRFQFDDEVATSFALTAEAYALGKLDKFHEAVAVYEDVIARFGESDVPTVQEWAVRALVGKGFTLCQMRDLPGGLAALKVSERLANGLPPEQKQSLLQMVEYNLACVHALLLDVDEAIASLYRMIEVGKPLDFEQIAHDGDFDAIRSEPRFVAFLAEHRGEGLAATEQDTPMAGKGGRR